MASNLQELDYLYARIALVEIIDRTGNCALIWTQIDPSTYQAEWTFDSVQYDLNLVYIPGNYLLDFVRGGDVVFSTSTNDDDTVWELVRLLTSPDSPIRESIQALRSNRGCDAIFREVGHGGVKVGGNKTKPSHRMVITDLLGGTQAAGISPNKAGFFAEGGAVMAGEAIHHENMHQTARGGVVTKGGAELPLLFAMGARYINNDPQINNYRSALYSFDTSGSQLKQLTEAAYGANGALDMWDVDYANGFMYTGVNGTSGINIHRRNLDYSHPVLLYTIPGGFAGGEEWPNMRYDMFRNVLWYNLGLRSYRYTFSGTPVNFFTDNAHSGNDIIVFVDAVYVLGGGTSISRFSPTGTLVSSVNLGTTHGVIVTSMAEDYTNDIIWVAGQIGSNNSASNNFVGTVSRDLNTFTIKYTSLDEAYRSTGIVIDNHGEGKVGYVMNVIIRGINSGHVNFHQFRTDGSDSTLACSIYHSDGKEPSGVGLRIWQKS